MEASTILNCEMEALNRAVESEDEEGNKVIEFDEKQPSQIFTRNEKLILVIKAPKSAQGKQASKRPAAMTAMGIDDFTAQMGELFSFANAAKLLLGLTANKAEKSVVRDLVGLLRTRCYHRSASRWKIRWWSICTASSRSRSSKTARCSSSWTPREREELDETLWTKALAIRQAHTG